MIYEKSVGQMGPGGFMKVRWQKNELSWRELLGATTMVFVAMPPPGPLGFRQAGCSHIISARGGGWQMLPMAAMGRVLNPVSN